MMLLKQKRNGKYDRETINKIKYMLLNFLVSKYKMKGQMINWVGEIVAIYER